MTRGGRRTRRAFIIFFARVGRKFCVIPTLDAFFFGYECNTDSINSQQHYESMRSARWPSACNFLCARRAENLQKWEMPATDPSRKWSFRRSLPHLGTACNLRFFACIHTSAFIKKTLRKLDSIRSLLYEQLRRRPKHRFSQNYTLHTMHTQKHARTAQKTIFSPARKSRPRA